MILRIARHTNNLTRISNLYTNVFRLEILGSFIDHNGYDGIFLGYENSDWHLEFTTSNHPVARSNDPDDMIVFYYYSDYETSEVIRAAQKFGMRSIKARNPYWERNGTALLDPDGNQIVVSRKEINLDGDDKYSRLLIEKGVSDWQSLLKYVRQIPYGRIIESTDLSDVIIKRKGTCSTKHSLLKSVADHYGLKNVKLILGLYKMNQKNTPGIGNTIQEYGLEYIPEAHCYLKVNGVRIDMTNGNSNISRIEDDILEEVVITPDQIGPNKVEYHKKALSQWIKENNIEISLTRLWQIRETCISNLSK